MLPHLIARERADSSGRLRHKYLGIAQRGESPNSDELDAFGGAISLSASGRTLAVGALGEDSAATGIDGNREDESGALAGAAYTIEAVTVEESRDNSRSFIMRIPGIGFTLALAVFAANVAIAAPPGAPQVTMGADIKLLRFDWEPVAGAGYYQLRFRPSGRAAYQPLGERIPATITQTEQSLALHLQDWAGMRFIVAACNSDGCTNSAALSPRSLMFDAIGYLKASNAETLDQFGRGVALSADGYTLAVTAMFESSNASGVNGDQANNLSQSSGAVYVFRRRGNAWQQEAYLKAGDESSPSRLSVPLSTSTFEPHRP